jgi:hypothetical protein
VRLLLWTAAAAAGADTVSSQSSRNQWLHGEIRDDSVGPKLQLHTFVAALSVEGAIDQLLILGTAPI